MKKLLFIVNTYKPGAIPNILNMIIPRLDIFSIYILTLEDSREELLKYAQSINCYIETINASRFNLLKTLLLLKRKIAEIDPDIIHSHMGRADIFSALSKTNHTALITTMHTMKRISLSNGLFNLTLLAYYFIDYKVSMRVSISNIVKNSWYDNYLSSPNTVIYNPILIKKAYDKEFKMNNDIKEFNISFVGRLIKIKNPMLILYAMNDIVNQYPNIHLNIAGDGPEKKKMLKYVTKNRLDKNITILGLLSHLDNLYKKTDLLIVSSIWTSGIPLVTLEAAMYQVPLLVPRVAGICEFFENGKNALLFKSGDKDDLKDKLVLLFKDNVLRKKLAENALLEFSNKFGIENISLQYLGLYNQILY